MNSLARHRSEKEPLQEVNVQVDEPHSIARRKANSQASKEPQSVSDGNRDLKLTIFEFTKRTSATQMKEKGTGKE